jgi:RecA-family ATPase
MEGSRNQSLFDAACQLRDAGKSQHEIQTELISRAIIDGLSPEEANKTLVSVFKREPRDEATSRKAGKLKRPSLKNRKPVTYKTAPKGEYKLQRLPLPEPIKDGARVLLREAFSSDENVRIVLSALDSDGKAYPDGKGSTLNRDVWLQKLDDLGGSLDVYGKDGGVFIGINPMRPNGSSDEAVTAFKYALVEFDSLDLESQYWLIKESDIPCVAVLSSGNRSLHAWVKVDANNRAEFDQRFKLLADHLADHIDGVNKNPSRLSRLPNSKRFNNRQELLALNIGAKSWSQWENEIKAEAVGERKMFSHLFHFDTKNDPNNLLGDRWLCRGSSAMFIAPSGVGKSTLVMQLAINWVQGLPVFGIAPEKPLTILIIQAENDEGDLAEMVQGACAGLDLKPGTDAFRAVDERLVLIEDSVSTGEQFTESLRVLIGKHRPDIVFVDPLLSFMGGNISDQETCTYFLRNLINPIAKESGACWIMVHHTPKPSTDPKSKQGWTAADYSYSGLGSSELVNWSRAIFLLKPTQEKGRFRLHLTKRGDRAGATDFEGVLTTYLHVKHSDHGLVWEQEPTPVVIKKEPKTKAKRKAAPKAAPKPKPSKAEVAEKRSKAASKQIHDLEGLVDKIIRPLTKTQIYKLAEEGGHGSAYIIRKNWSVLSMYLIKNKNLYQQK